MKAILTFLMIGCKALPGASYRDNTVEDINAEIEEIAREFNGDITVEDINAEIEEFTRDFTVEDINAEIEEIAREFNRDAEVIKSAIDEIDEEIHIGLVRFWGQKCVLSVQCLHFYLGTHLVQVSVCDRGTGLTGLDGSCKPSTMVWVLLAVLLLMVSSCSVISYYSRQR